MGTKPTEISASRFKADCLSLLDRVAKTGESYVITKRGRPVARVVPLETQEVPSLAGSLLWDGHLLEPIDVEWDAEK